MMAEKKRNIENVSLIELRKYSLQLANKIKDKGYEVEHILYVERAGLFIAYEVAQYFGCSISGIHAKRGGNSLKSRVRIILRWLPKRVTDLMRRIEEKSNMHAVKSDRNVYFEEYPPPKGKKLLIIDDAVDTGNSLMAVINSLVSKGYRKENLYTCVLTTTKKHPKFEADISLFNGISFAFPWSYDSNEYDEAWKLYERIKSSISS